MKYKNMGAMTTNNDLKKKMSDKIEVPTAHNGIFYWDYEHREQTEMRLKMWHAHALQEGTGLQEDAETSVTKSPTIV